MLCTKDNTYSRVFTRSLSSLVLTHISLYSNHHSTDNYALVNSSILDSGVLLNRHDLPIHADMLCTWEEAEVCDEVDYVYGPYINKLYNERRVFKMILKAYEK